MGEAKKNTKNEFNCCAERFIPSWPRHELDPELAMGGFHLVPRYTVTQRVVVDMDMDRLVVLILPLLPRLR